MFAFLVCNPFRRSDRFTATLPIRQSIETLSLGESTKWVEIVNLPESILQTDNSWRDLRARGQRHYNEAHVALGALCRLGSILSASSAQSLAMQISLAKDFEKLFRSSPSIMDKILLPFFEAYWDNAITSASASFRTAAAYTRRSFEVAVAAPARVRLKELFKSMVFCLGLSLPADLRSWLDN